MDTAITARPAMKARRLAATLVAPTALPVAAGVGLLAAYNAQLAIGALAGLVFVPTALWRPKLMPPILVVTIFANFLTVGGTTLNRLTAPAAVLAVLSQLIQSRPRLRQAGLTLAVIGAYALLGLSSLAWTLSLDGTVFALSALAISLAYAAALATLIQNEREVRRVLWTTAACSVALGLWWIGSYAAGVYRASNSAGDPNFFALLQLIALPLIMVLARSVRHPAHRAGMYAGVGIVAASIVATLSRGGFLTLILMGGLMAVLPSRWLFGSPQVKAAFMGAALVGLGIVLATASGDLAQRFEDAFGGPGAAEGRGNLALAAVHGFQEHPATGMGFGAFKPNSFDLLRTTPDVYLQAHLRFAYIEGQPAHNAYLESLAELGVPGAVLFVGLLGTTGFSLARTARWAEAGHDTFTASVAGGLAVGLAAVSVSSFALSTETSRALWLLVGLSLALPSVTSSRHQGGRTIGPQERANEL